MFSMETLSFNFKVYRVIDLETNTAEWVDYSTLEILEPGADPWDDEAKPLIKFENPTSKSGEVKKFTTSYSTYAHFFKHLPDEEFPEPKIKFRGSNSLFVLEDVKLPSSSLDRFQIAAIEMPLTWDKAHFKQIKFKILTTLNLKFCFSREAFLWTITDRMRTLIYKCTKEVLNLTVRRLSNVSSLAFLTINDVLQHLRDHNEAGTFNVQTILEMPNFVESAKNLIYKTLLTYGIFPAFVEINTMGENRVEKIKQWVFKFFADSFVSPWGPLYHASFILGGRRYNFVNDPRNPSYQDRLLISDLSQRSFGRSSEDRNFFQLKLFDFFPLDHWVEGIWDLIRAKPLPSSKTFSAKESLKSFCLRNAQKLAYAIAEEFYNEYINHLPQSIWVQFVSVLADIELRDYSITQNNCQTIVSEIVYILSQRLQKYLEPKLEPNLEFFKIIYGDDAQSVLENALNRFGAQPKLPVIRHFKLVHKLDYFSFYVDKITRECLSSGNFDKLDENFQGAKYNKFLKMFYDEFCVQAEVFRSKRPSFIEKSPRVSDDLKPTPQEEEEKKDQLNLEVKFPKDVSVELDVRESDSASNGGKDKNYDYIHYLMHCVYNDLFKLKRSIKVTKEKIKSQLSRNDIAFNKLGRGSIMRILDEEPQMNDVIGPLVEEINKYSIEKNKKKFILHEICFHFYNGLRASLLTKERSELTYMGPVIITNLEKPRPNFERISADMMHISLNK